jgi:hypothetical protein
MARPAWASLAWNGAVTMPRRRRARLRRWLHAGGRSIEGLVVTVALGAALATIVLGLIG